MDLGDDCQVTTLNKLTQPELVAYLARNPSIGKTFLEYVQGRVLRPPPFSSVSSQRDSLVGATMKPNFIADMVQFLVEHYVEKNMIARFVQACIIGILQSGGAFPEGLAIPGDFFQDFMSTPQTLLNTVVSFPGSRGVLTPNTRIMSALGTRAYTANFMLLQSIINNMKSNASTNTL